MKNKGKSLSWGHTASNFQRPEPPPVYNFNSRCWETSGRLCVPKGLGFLDSCYSKPRAYQHGHYLWSFRISEISELTPSLLMRTWIFDQIPRWFMCLLRSERHWCKADQLPVTLEPQQGVCFLSCLVSPEGADWRCWERGTVPGVSSKPFAQDKDRCFIF